MPCFSRVGLLQGAEGFVDRQDSLRRHLGFEVCLVIGEREQLLRRSGVAVLARLFRTVQKWQQG